MDTERGATGLAAAGDDWLHRPEDLSPTVSVIVGDLIRRGLDVAVHAGDEMYQTHYWSHGEDRELALGLYFASGRSLWSTIRQALRWRFGDLGRIERLLDFASGFGRVTRFLVNEVPPQRVWVSDIQEDAVAAQIRQFGVTGVVSDADPARLDIGAAFDAIVVSSLFTHLPRPAFEAWLRRLSGLLAPGGVLLFSVHDVSLLGDDGGDDFVFRAESESGKVAAAEYGSTWVSPRFVESALSAARPGASWRRYPRGFASLQDLYVVVPEPGAAIDLRLRRQADGALDTCRVDGRNVLRLQGWVRDRVSRTKPIAVRFTAGDATAVLPADELAARRDVDRILPGDAVPAWGFRIALDLGQAWDPAAMLSIRAQCADGEEALLIELPLHDALLGNARLALVWEQRATAAAEAELAHERRLARLVSDEARHREEIWVSRQEGWWARRDQLSGRIAALEDTIRWMETSRFWLIRNRWWAVKDWVRARMGRA